MQVELYHGHELVECEAYWGNSQVQPLISVVAIPFLCQNSYLQYNTSPNSSTVLRHPVQHSNTAGKTLHIAHYDKSPMNILSTADTKTGTAKVTLAIDARCPYDFETLPDLAAEVA